MAKTKGTVSNGGRQRRNVAHEKKRQEKFAAKRGTEKEYKYKPIPDGLNKAEYNREKLARAEKAKSSKLPLARWTSIMRKLSNELEKEKELAKSNA